jgi:signal recognition particle receptor subunit beta
MAIVNHTKKEINAKIVYYGPGLSGKATNLKFIYEKMKPEFRGMLRFLNTQSGKMYFFDFMRPDQIGIEDYNIRFHIYTVPGEVIDFAIWKTVLKGADGLVFVADSDPEKLAANMDSLKSLTDYMAAMNTGLHEIPCIFQCNKQDISGAFAPEELKKILDVENLPMIPAVTQKGEGVLNTLSTIVKMVMQRLRETPLGIEREETIVAAAAEPVITSAAEEPAETELQPSACNFAEEESPSTCILEEEVLSETNLDAAAYHGFTSQEYAQVTVEEIEPPAQDIEAAEIRSTIHFTGEVEQVSPGCFRLPITLTCGEIQKNIALTFTLSLENSGN